MWHHLRLKKSLKQVLLILFSVVLTLCVVNFLLPYIFVHYNFAELVFADSFKAPKEQRLFFADSSRIYKLADQKLNTNIYPDNPNQLEWNVDQLGFRPDVRPNTEQGESTFTILMIGDSFTYGSFIRHMETYPTQLEAKLLAEGYDVNIINAGVPGYGTDQELIYLKELLPVYQPDLVVWNLFENDITDSNYYCLFDYSNEQLTQLPAWKNNVYRQGVIVNAVPWTVAKTPIFKLLTHSVGFPVGWDQRVPITTLGCTKQIDPEVTQKLGKKVEALLTEANKEAQLHQAEMMFVLMPSQRSFEYPVSSREELEHIELIRNFSLLKKRTFIDLTRELEKSYIKVNSTQALQKTWSLQQCIDIYHQFYLSEKEEPNPNSRHLNAAGNEVVAEIVKEAILAQFPQ
jgi:lysophospholipase L1-like esterase